MHPAPRHRELLGGGKQRRRECALALEQQAEPPGILGELPDFQSRVGCAGIDAVILSGCSSCFGKCRPPRRVGFGRIRFPADSAKRPGSARQQEWYREAFLLRLLAKRPGGGAFLYLKKEFDPHDAA